MADAPHDPSQEKPAPKAVIGRVSLYLRQLEAFLRQGQETVSSSQLGNALSINDAQVRKDLAFFGQFGYPGIGYRIEELMSSLRRILGIDRNWPSTLIGLGNLGRALLRYRGFRSRGFNISALFDNDPRKVGQNHGGFVVQSLDELPQTVKRHGLRLAILTVPADAAQDVADLAVESGIQGILNFAPTTLVVPESISLVAVDLSIQLEHLAYMVLNQPGNGEVK